METEWIPYEEAVGRVAAASIIPYPPGIPLLIGGEKIVRRSIFNRLESCFKWVRNFKGQFESMKDK